VPLRGMLAMLTCVAACASCSEAGASVQLYKSDPDFIWNRVHRILHARVSQAGEEYGSDNLDPPLWPETRYLLTGESHRQALMVLDEFLALHSERMITDPLQRAIFQHDLWSVFDWSDGPTLQNGTPAERLALQSRLARIIQRVALSRVEIEKLPDNLQAAAQASSDDLRELPTDIFRLHGPWVCVFPGGGAGQAPVHRGFNRESSFLVFFSLPGGQEQTRAYLKRLDESRQPWILTRYHPQDPQFILKNPSLPQFPPGTRVALLRQMLLVDISGEVVPTHLTESIQMRAYKTVPADSSAVGQQEDLEFRLSRTLLFAGRAGGLRRIKADDTEFPVFMTQGDDPFEGSESPPALPIIKRCGACHEGNGIYTVRSYANELAPRSGPAELPGLFEGTPAELIQGASKPTERNGMTWAYCRAFGSDRKRCVLRGDCLLAREQSPVLKHVGPRSAQSNSTAGAQSSSRNLLST